MPVYKGATDYGAGIPVHQFQLDTGEDFETADPMIAMQLGAPVAPPSPVHSPERGAMAQNASVPELNMSVPEEAFDGSPMMMPDGSVAQGAEPVEPVEGVEPPGMSMPGMEQEPPQVALSPEQLALMQTSRYKVRKGRPGGWVDKTATLEGSPQERQGLAEGIRALAEDRISTAQKEMQVQAAIYQRHIAESEAAALTARQQAEEKRAQIAEFEAYKQERSAELTKKAQEVSSRHVDHRRWYKDQSPATTLVAILSQGLGAFGSAITGGPNTAVQMINRYIDADIADQEAELDAAKGELNVEQNAFARELAEGKDPALARQELKLIMQQYQIAQLQNQELRESMAMLGIDTEQVIQGIQQDQIDGMMKLNDHYTVKYQQQYQKAVRPGLVEKKPEELLKEAKARAELNYMSAGENPDAGQRLAERKQNFAESKGATGDIDERVEKFGKRMNEGSVSMARVASARERLATAVLRQIKETGGDLEGQGIGRLLPDALAGDGGRKIRRLAAEADEMALRQVSGAVIGQDERADMALRSQLQDKWEGYSEAEFVTAVNEQLRESLDTMNNVAASFGGEEVTREWLKRRKSSLSTILDEGNRGTLDLRVEE